MKKIFTLTAGLLMAGFATAQAPMFDFEAWGSQLGSFPHPNGWTSANVIGAAGNDSVVIKATGANAHSGAAAMKIETIKLANNIGSGIGLPDTVCWAITGQIVTIPTTSVKTGFPYTIRANEMNFWYKYAPAANDSATAGVILTKWNGTSRDTVATGKKFLGTSSSYKADTVFLTYKPAYASSGNPDTANIYFASSKIKSFVITGIMSIAYQNPQIGSMLWIDDCGPQLVGMKEIITEEEVNFYPNPASTVLHFSFENGNERTIEIFDLSGKMVKKASFQSKTAEINVEKLASGMYFYQIKNDNNRVTSIKKFMIAD